MREVSWEGADAAAGDGGGKAVMVFVMVDAGRQRADCRSFGRSAKSDATASPLAARLTRHRTSDTSNACVHFIYHPIHTYLLLLSSPISASPRHNLVRNSNRTRPRSESPPAQLPHVAGSEVLLTAAKLFHATNTARVS